MFVGGRRITTLTPSPSLPWVGGSKVSQVISAAASFEDTVATSDAYAVSSIMRQVDGATATDDSAVRAFSGVVESVLVVDAAIATTDRRALAEDTATAADDTDTAFRVHVADSIAASDALRDVTEERSADFVVAADAYTLSTARSVLLADRASAHDASLPMFVRRVAEQALATDATSVRCAVLLADTATATDGYASSTGHELALTDGAATDDAVSLRVDAHTLVADSAAATDAARYKDPGLVAWVMNTETGAVSWYSNYAFVDIVQFGGATYAVGPAGLSMIGAETDNGDTIDAAVVYGFNEFGGYDRSGMPEEAPKKKRLDGLVFGHTADGRLEASIETYGQGLGAYTYTMPPVQADQPINGRIRPGRGLLARYWRIGISNTDGCGFEVNSIEADVITTSRRL